MMVVDDKLILVVGIHQNLELAFVIGQTIDAMKDVEVMKATWASNYKVAKEACVN